MSIFNEKFFEIEQLQNQYCYVKAAGILYPDKNYMIERENSSTIVMGYILSGNMVFEYEDIKYHAIQGDSFIVPSNMEYKIYSSKNNLPTTIWINISGELVECLIQLYFKDKKILISPYDCEKEIRKIIDESKTQRCFCNEISIGVHRLILQMKDNYKSPAEMIMKDNLFNQMENYIKNSVQEPFSVEKLSERFEMTYSTVNKIFKDKFHCTPYQYYQAIRHDIAKSLLKNTNITIEDIASRLNFYDRNHFTAHFIAKENISPAAYRKEYKPF